MSDLLMHFPIKELDNLPHGWCTQRRPGSPDVLQTGVLLQGHHAGLHASGQATAQLDQK